MTEPGLSNLTKCPDCAGVVSIRAAACPHCGCPVSRQPGLDELGGQFEVDNSGPDLSSSSQSPSTTTQVRRFPRPSTALSFLKLSLLTGLPTGFAIAVILSLFWMTNKFPFSAAFLNAFPYGFFVGMSIGFYIGYLFRQEQIVVPATKADIFFRQLQSKLAKCNYRPVKDQDRIELYRPGGTLSFLMGDVYIRRGNDQSEVSAPFRVLPKSARDLANGPGTLRYLHPVLWSVFVLMSLVFFSASFREFAINAVNEIQWGLHDNAFSPNGMTSMRTRVQNLNARIESEFFWNYYLMPFGIFFGGVAATALGLKVLNPGRRETINKVSARDKYRTD